MAAQYKTVEYKTVGERKTVGGRTSIDTILDLDEERDNQVNNKFIRKFKNTRSEARQQIEARQQMGHQQMGPHQQMDAQRMISRNTGFNNDLDYNDNLVESYEQLTITAVANSVFPTTSSYINALDNSEHPLHAVARGLLSSGDPASCDKTIYIIIIIILSIAIACLLYRLNRN